MVEKHNSGLADEFHTTSDFWECECGLLSMAIHPATEDVCLYCGSKREDSPDATIEDIIRIIRGSK